MTNANFEYILHGSVNPATMGLSSSSGEGEPFEIIPPYISMNACKKIEDIAMNHVTDSMNLVTESISKLEIELLIALTTIYLHNAIFLLTLY